MTVLSDVRIWYRQPKNLLRINLTTLQQFVVEHIMWRSSPGTTAFQMLLVVVLRAMVPLSTKKVFTTSDFPSMTKNRRTCWPRRSFVFSSPNQASGTLMAAVANVNVSRTWHLTAMLSTLYNSTCCSSPAIKPMNLRAMEIRLGFTLLTSARTNQDALSMLLSYCSTVCQYVEREDISIVAWALTSKEWNLIDKAFLCLHVCTLVHASHRDTWQVRQNQVSSHSFYTQVIPGRGAWPDLPQPDCYGLFHPEATYRRDT